MSGRLDAINDAASLMSALIAYHPNAYRVRAFLSLTSWPLDDTKLDYWQARQAARRAMRFVPALRPRKTRSRS